MFENIGNKIKILAKGLFWVDLAAIVLLLIVFSGMPELLCFLLIFVGPLLAWVRSMLIYGFGELIATNQEIRDQLKDKSDNLPSSVCE